MSVPHLDPNVSPHIRVERLLTYIRSSTQGQDERYGDRIIIHKPQLVSAEGEPNPKTVFKLTVEPEMCNRVAGTLHGGLICALFDNCTGTVVFTLGPDKIWPNVGVSRYLHVDYLHPVTEGDEIYIESEVADYQGKKMLLKGTLRRVRDGKVCAVCKHLKQRVGTAAAIASKPTSKL